MDEDIGSARKRDRLARLLKVASILYASGSTDQGVPVSEIARLTGMNVRTVYRDLRALALRRLAAIARRLKRHGDAEGYLAAALAADPECREALKDLAELKRDLGDLEAARSAYEEYVKTFGPGEAPDAESSIAFADLLEDREPQRALDLLLAAEKAGFKGSALKKKLGHLQARLGRWDDAFQSIQEFLERSAAETGGGPAEEKDRALEREKAREFLREKVIPRLGEVEEGR